MTRDSGILNHLKQTTGNNTVDSSTQKCEHGRRQNGAMANLVRGFRPFGSLEELTVVLWAYFDDSADEQAERFSAAGGVFTADSVWLRLEKAWLEVMRDLNGKPFHATDCEAGQGDFKDWPMDRRDALMASACEVVRRFDLAAIGSCVSTSDFLEFWPESDRYDRFMLCASLCIAHTAQISETSSMMLDGILPPDSVNFWFEHNQRTASREMEMFSSLKAATNWVPSRQIGGIAHVDKSVAGVQIADFIARETFKHFDNKGIRPTRKPVAAIAKHLSLHRWTRHELEYVAKNGGPDDHRVHIWASNRIASAKRSQWSPL